MLTYGGLTTHLPNGAYLWWGGLVSLLYFFNVTVLQT